MATGVGTATIDFGSSGQSSLATVVVGSQTGLTAAGSVESWMQGDATADHNAFEHLVAGITLRCGDVGTDTFTIYASTDWHLTGTFTVHWVWSA